MVRSLANSFVRRLASLRGAGLTAVVLLVVVVVWLAGSVLSTGITLAAAVLLIFGTWRVVSPEVGVFLGRGDPRPWLVRFREHHWRPVTLIGGRTVSRGLAYAVLALGWWWLLR